MDSQVLNIFCPVCDNIIKASYPYKNICCDICKCYVYYKDNEKIRVLCNCNTKISINQKFCGREGKCPKCNNKIIIPKFTVKFQREKKIHNRIWKWYKRHDNVINVILDIACTSIPGAGVFINGLRLAQASLMDNRELKAEKQIENIEQGLIEIKPLLNDIVEDIEDLKAFQLAENEEERKNAINKNVEVRTELNRILPELSQTLIKSVSRIKNKNLLAGRYEIKQKIGKGGQAEVVMGIDLTIGEEVALKIFPKELVEDNVAIEKLKQEYKYLVERLEHKNIVQYRELRIDKESNKYFIVMDIVKGKNLRSFMLENKQLELVNVIKFLMPVAEALDFSHRKGIVHKDVKPENILIREQDNKVFITDFGLASEVRDSLSQNINTSQDISGTLPYMSPEQYMGRRIDITTDNWAFGVILYEMIEGVHPFQGRNFEHYMKLVCEVEPETPINMNIYAWNVLKEFILKNKQERPRELVPAMRELLRTTYFNLTQTNEFMRTSDDSDKIEIKESEETERVSTIKIKAKIVGIMIGISLLLGFFIEGGRYLLDIWIALVVWIATTILLLRKKLRLGILGTSIIFLTLLISGIISQNTRYYNDFSSFTWLAALAIIVIPLKKEKLLITKSSARLEKNIRYAIKIWTILVVLFSLLFTGIILTYDTTGIIFILGVVFIISFYLLFSYFLVRLVLIVFRLNIPKVIPIIIAVFFLLGLKFVLGLGFVLIPLILLILFNYYLVCFIVYACSFFIPGLKDKIKSII